MKMCNKEKIVSIMLTGLILVNLTGCQNQDEKITKSVEASLNNEKISESVEKTTTINTTESNNVDKTTINNKEQFNGSASNINTNIDENLSKDDIIINYFNAATDDINNLLSSESVTNAKVKCKEYFITFVDFIFYDGKIKDITFSELKEETKKQVITIVQKVDTLIMKKFPNYKETISEKSKSLYDKASELLHSGKENIGDYVESKVGEETYQDILNEIDDIKQRDKDTWNDMKDFGSNVYESGKDKVKNWYENFKNK